MASRNYKYYQPNEKDLKDEYGDCVVRALTKVTGKTWRQVFDELLPYAYELQCMPNGKKCYESYLKANGFEYHGISNKKRFKTANGGSFYKGSQRWSLFLECCKSLRGICGRLLLRYMGVWRMLHVWLLGKEIKMKDKNNEMVPPRKDRQ